MQVRDGFGSLSSGFGHAWPDEGAQLLDGVEAFLARFVAFPSEAAKVAVTLFAAHTHLVLSFDYIDTGAQRRRPALGTHTRDG